MTLDARLEARVAESVEFVFTVTNPTMEHVELSFPEGLVADVAVFETGKATDESDPESREEVWRWSAGRVFTQTLQTETLAPGETSVYTVVWEDPEPGEYRATASLEARGVQAEAGTTFRYGAE